MFPMPTFTSARVSLRLIGQKWPLDKHYNTHIHTHILNS